MIALPVLNLENGPTLQDTKWIDGLRGIASLFVVSSHVMLCYARALQLPCCAEGRTTPWLFQRPIFRLVSSGHSWVAVFLILSGFVNALKPVKSARAGQLDSSLQTIARSSFGRIFRLILPATASTILNWVLCQLGLFEIARNSDAYWISAYSPPRSENFPFALADLFDALKASWMIDQENIYDQPQWVLIHMLHGSMMLVCALLVTVNMTPKWRIGTMAIFSLWSINWTLKGHDPWNGLCFFPGVILAEFCLSDIPESIVRRIPLVAPPLGLVGLILMSCPTMATEQATWSRLLHQFGWQYLPYRGDDLDLARVYGSIGGLLLIFSVTISPHARWFLSTKPLLWLGKISFAIYLLQAAFMRTVLAWILSIGQQRSVPMEGYLAGTDHVIHVYSTPGGLQCAIATVIFMICLLAASHLWNMKLEPIFAALTRKIENLVRNQPAEELNDTKAPDLLPVHTDQRSKAP